jgi:uncharacterized oxidoreductase
MKLTGNTILITGGGSGIGRGLAEALHKKGNTVIIAGRRKEKLQETVDANPGMHSVQLDIESAEDIKKVAQEIIAKFPKLNVLLNNAGIMQIDDVSTAVDDALITSTITTNLLGPIRLTSALVEHLKKQEASYILNVSSVLAFVPLTLAAVYSSTKAALHSYSHSLRYKLADTSVKVLEVAPPWVQTDLLNSNKEPRAMPLRDYIEETVRLLETDAEEVLVERAVPLRAQAGINEKAFIVEFNDMMSGKKEPVAVS